MAKGEEVDLPAVSKGTFSFRVILIILGASVTL